MTRYNVETLVTVLIAISELVLIANSVAATRKGEIDHDQHLEYKCIHDKIAPEIKKVLPEHVSRKRRSDEEFEFTSTVVHVHPDASITSSEDFSYLWTNKTSPFWRALETVSKGLLVRKGQPDNLTAIAPACEVFTSGENEGYCINGTLEQVCGIFSYPDSLSEQEYVCNSENGSCGFEGVEGPGVEANYILILGATDDYYCGNSVLGFASFCNLEFDFYRPINGFINICPTNVKSSDTIFKVDSIMYNLLLHELLHALGFSSSLYYFYHEEESIVVEEQCGNEPVFGLETPNITEHVHNYFNCSEIDYAPLENYGSASASSHWEARVFNHEIMTAFISYDYQVFSNVTWHYFQDSQWYEVNYTYTNALDQFGAEWGKGEGCDIFTCNCSDYEYSCVGGSQCTFDRIAKGSCSDHIAFDDCDVVISDEHGSCLSSINYVNTADDLFDLTQSYGRLSRCFDVRDTDDCSYLPACYETKMFKYLATNEYAYQIIGHEDYTNESNWCYEGKHVEVGSDYVLCPNVEELLLHFDPSDIHDADTFVPPPLCHESCETCSTAHDESKCLTCYTGDLTGPPPSACINDTDGYQDIECVPVLIQLGCLPKFNECCTEGSCKIDESNCYCDVSCHNYGDCCHDIDETCPEPEESTIAQTSTETLPTSTASKSTSVAVVSVSSSSQEMSSTSETVTVVTTEVIATTVSQAISTTELVETTSIEPTTEVIATTTKVTSSMREVPTTEIIAEATTEVISTTTSSESTIATTTKVISTTSGVVETTSSEQTTEVIAATTEVISSEASTEAIATTTKVISTTSEVETTSSEQTAEIIAATTTPEVVETTSEQTTEVIVATTKVISTTSEVETTSSEQTTKIIATTTIPEVVETTLEQTTEVIAATTKVTSTTSEVETTSSEPTTEAIATTTRVISTTAEVVETTSPEQTTKVIATTTAAEVVEITPSEPTTEAITTSTKVISTTSEVTETTFSDSNSESPRSSPSLIAPSITLATSSPLVTPSSSPIGAYDGCRPTCRQSVVFDMDLCLFYCQLEEWRKTMNMLGFTTIPAVEELKSENATSESRWRTAIEHHQLYFDIWLEFAEDQGLFFEQETTDDENSLISEWQVDSEQGAVEAWREYAQQRNPDLKFLDFQNDEITEDLTGEQFSAIYANISREWSSDLILYKTLR